MTEFKITEDETSVRLGRVIGGEVYPMLGLLPGGTGECWNISEDDVDDDDACSLHVCDLDEFIAALVFLRDSETHRRNVERWK